MCGSCIFLVSILTHLCNTFLLSKYYTNIREITKHTVFACHHHFNFSTSVWFYYVQFYLVTTDIFGAFSVVNISFLGTALLLFCSLNLYKATICTSDSNIGWTRVHMWKTIKLRIFIILILQNWGKYLPQSFHKMS